jgi:hypothetical protein
MSDTPPEASGLRQWIPSPQALAQTLRTVPRRFPLPLLFAYATMGVVLASIRDPTFDQAVPLALGISLFLALRLAGETGVLKRPVEIGLTVAGVVAIVALHLTWESGSETARAIRYGQLFLASHLMVAVLPFLGGGHLRGVLSEARFRPFNRHLLLRFIEGSAQALILFVGISAALLAIDRLFGVSVPDLTYARLSVVLYFGFLPTHLLAGIADPTVQREDEDPRVLRVLGRWILLPLSSLYLLILTAYFVQVLVTRTWPTGWIVWLVSWMAVVGILTVLLTRPGKEGSEALRPDPASRLHLWERGFWLLMLLAAAMLLMALWQRIQQYAITEPRYLAGVLGVWLACMAVLYASRRDRDLRWIPATLLVLVFLTGIGPWSALEVSKRSQLHRLEAVQRRVAAATDREAVSETDRVQAREILTYLFRVHPGVEIAGVSTDAAGGRAEGVGIEEMGAEGVGVEGQTPMARAEAAALALGIDPPREGGPEGAREGERWIRLDRNRPLSLDGAEQLLAVRGGDEWRGSLLGEEVRLEEPGDGLLGGGRSGDGLLADGQFQGPFVEVRLVMVAPGAAAEGWRFDLSPLLDTETLSLERDGFWHLLPPERAQIPGVWFGERPAPADVVLVPVDVRFEMRPAAGSTRLRSLAEGWVLVTPRG